MADLCTASGPPCGDLSCDGCLWKQFGVAPSPDSGIRDVESPIALPRSTPSCRSRSRSPGEERLRELAREEHDIEDNIRGLENGCTDSIAWRFRGADNQLPLTELDISPTVPLGKGFGDLTDPPVPISAGGQPVLVEDSQVP